MTHDEKPTYNGWSNYETWAVNLWLSNEEGSYRYWADRTRELIAECADEDADRSALARLAEELKESIHESCAIERASLAADLMNAALGEVDWREIAKSLIEDHTPEAPDDPDLIHAYTRADALADGTLIDVTATAKEAGFRYPVALTSAAWHECVRVPDGVSGQDEAGRLWDVLTLLGHASRSAGKGRSEVRFRVLVRNDETSPKPVSLKSVCGPDDDRSPCLTVMLPDENSRSLPRRPRGAVRGAFLETAPMETILNPLSQESAVLVTGYPLTREELRILAAHWATVYIEASADATLMNSVGSTDLRLFEYVATRHRLMEPILGDEAMTEAVRTAEARVRGRIGDELYAAYLKGESPLGDLIEAEHEPGPRPDFPCVVCGKDVAADDEEPTFCGGVHARCLPDHVRECGVCRPHPPLARKAGLTGRT